MQYIKYIKSIHCTLYIYTVFYVSYSSITVGKKEKGRKLKKRKKTWRKKCMSLSERSQSKKATYYKIPSIWKWRKGRLPGVGSGHKVEVINRQEQKIYRVVKMLCMVDSCYTFVQTHHTDSTKSEFYIKLWIVHDYDISV